jgi:peptidoglycan/LPS O-acetylase OafA/YrhL
MSTLTRAEKTGSEEIVDPQGRILAIDGLRAVAVLAVIAFHFGLGVTGGFLGVDLFFVISGFVITRLLLQRSRKSRIDLSRFWFARAKRLLPAVLLLLVTVQIWLRTDSTASLRDTTNAQSLAALVYGSNWYAIYGGLRYWDLAAEETPLNHLWSLAVEEQFYLLWPAVLIAALLAFSRKTLVAALAMACTGAYALAAFFYIPGSFERAYMGTDTRAAAMLVGCAVALVLVRRESVRYADPAISKFTHHNLVGTLALGLLVWLWCTASIDTANLYRWQLPLAGLAAAVLIAMAVHAPRQGLFAVLASRPLVALGNISYGLYLWHWPVWVYLTINQPAWPHPQRVVVALGATFAISLASYFCVEKPIRRTRARARHVVPWLVLAAVAVAVSCLWFQPPPPVEQQTGVVVSGG